MMIEDVIWKEPDDIFNTILYGDKLLYVIGKLRNTDEDQKWKSLTSVLYNEKRSPHNTGTQATKKCNDANFVLTRLTTSQQLKQENTNGTIGEESVCDKRNSGKCDKRS